MSRRPGAAANGPMETLAKGGVTNFYWQYFQKPGVAEAEFERDVDFTMRSVTFGVDDSLYLKDGFGFLGNPAIERKLPNWTTAADHAHVVETYKRTGFRGGLNWYRNIDRNWELTAPWQGAKIHQPSIFIAGSKGFCRHQHSRRQTRHRDGARGAEPETQTDYRRRRSLDSAGAPR